MDKQIAKIMEPAKKVMNALNYDKGVVLGSSFGQLIEIIKEQQAEIEKLSKDSAFLNCLEACGVDNWCGYSDAWEMFESEEE